MKLLSKFIVAFAFMFYVNSSVALDVSSTMTEKTKNIVESIKKEFMLTDISSEMEKKIADKFSFFLKDSWQSFWLGNEDLQRSKFADSDVRIYDLYIVNEGRIGNVTFTYFKEANQIFCVSRQYVTASPSRVLDIFKETKEDESMEITRETDVFAIANKKDYLTYELFHIKAPNAMIVYLDANIIDLNH